MIILLHGDNLAASRRELQKLKTLTKTKEIRQLDGRLLDTTALIQALESNSLFGGGEKVVIIENLFGKLGKKTKLIEELSKIIVQSSKDNEIIMWEDKEIGKTIITSLGPKTEIRLFKIPTVVFQFLDNLRPNNTKVLLNLFQQTVTKDAAELVFTLLVRRFRQLIMLEYGVTPEGLQGWQVSRLTNQAKLFTIEKLLSMYKKFLDIEYSLKTGSSPFNLSQHIELFLIDL